MKTHVLLDHEPLPQGGRVARVLLRLEADPPLQADRLPLNLSLVLDRSGSMSGEPLAAARDAAALLVRRLATEDVVSVVAYDDDVVTVAEPARGDAQADLPRRIAQIEVGGSTNLSGGWLRGRELVTRNLLARGVNRVILLTDGMANVGITDHPRLTGLTVQARSAGVTTTTIGFGPHYDEKLLRGMADAGGGNMYYVETLDQAAAIFADELQGLLDLGAQNVTVTVQPAPAVTLAAVHHDYPRTHSADGLRLELGDLYAREPKPLLVELVAGDVVSDTHLLTLVVAGDVLTASGDVEHQVITLPVTLTAGEVMHVEPDVRREMLLLAAAQARRTALELRENGDYTAAANLLRATGATLREAGLNDAELMEEAADITAMSEIAPAAFTIADAKYMYQRAYTSTSGRRSKSNLIRRRREEEEPPTA